jgi:double-stranded uracil-DNA glycosylase
MGMPARDGTLHKRSFEAMADERTRVVIFGSLPGDVSLARNEYYAKSTNQFWRLMQAVIEVDLSRETPYELRRQRLLSAGVGLWDVIESAHRPGSLDAAIRGHRENDLMALAARLPSLRALAFNGGKSFKLGRKQLGDAGPYSLLPLPSSSAAYCAMSFDRKAAEWMRLRVFLDRTA